MPRVRTTPLVYTEAPNEEYSPIVENLDNLSLEWMRRSRAFQFDKTMAQLRPPLEYLDTAKKELRPFWDMPDFIPLKLKSESNYDNLQGIDWDTISDKDIKEVLLPNFEPLKARRVNYTKPIAIIYNPNSGKKRDLKPLIEERLSAHNIPYVLIPTQKKFDTFQFAYDLDLSLYSALVSVGGDGSISEVYNGMMARPDGVRLPLGVVPNGSGNCWAYTLGIENPDEALDTLIAATVLKADSVRVLADVENNEDVAVGQEGYKHRRYCLCLANDGDFITTITQAIPLKPYFGNASYFMCVFKLLLIDGLKNHRFDLEVDGVKVSNNK